MNDQSTFMKNNGAPSFFVRIGMPADTPTEPTPELLSEVHYRAALSVPYENLDILDGKRISLDRDALFDKIVTRARGGYCFEVNALLEHMLREMGFSVRSCLARFLRGESTVPLRRHRIAIVTLNGEKYFCDIGIGQSAPRLPLLLKEGIIQEQFAEKYRFLLDGELGWVLYDLHQGQWRKFISFTEEKQYEVDYVEPSFYCEAHPDSPFNKKAMVAIKTADGRKTVDGRDFKIFKGTELVRIEENMSEERFWEVLSSEFGIILR